MILLINLRIYTFFHNWVIFRIISWHLRGFLNGPKCVKIIHIIELAHSWARKTSDSTIPHLIILNDDTEFPNFLGFNLLIRILLSGHFNLLPVDAELSIFNRLILTVIENIVKVVNIKVFGRTLRVFVLSLFDVHGCETSRWLIGCIA